MDYKSSILKLAYRLVFFMLVIILMASGLALNVQAKNGEPPEEPARDTGLLEGEAAIMAAIDTASTGIAWGDPDGAHSVYSWPYTAVQMGHVIQSYQNYSSGTSAAYFHHGIDTIAPNGTDVFTRSGGQVVNVENYQAGNDLYWEIAILDPEGYVWQYHHIDKNTIPQAIKDAFTAWKANHSTGGFIPANTYIGDIVYWTVTSFGYRFNHTHINILGAGDVYLNPLEFMTPLNDTQAPQIQAIGLLNGNTIISGTVASGNYGMYVRARDLFLSTVYYLPPYKTEFSIDGGEWTTVWEFDDLPGGASDTAFVNDFFVAPPTCGNYSCREFYIDLGFTPSGQRAFPTRSGAHSITVRVWDYNGNNTSSTFDWTVEGGTNEVPVAHGQSLSSTEDAPLAITLTGSDADGDPLTYAIVTNPTHGSVSGTAPNVTYTPSANYNGSDSFTFVVNDGLVDSAAATVSITVTPVNDSPTATAQSVTTAEDTAKAITLSGTDVDGNPLTYSTITNPSHGNLSGTAPALTYTPSANFNGADSFTFKVNDGTVDSAEATVSITVTAVNDVPVPDAQSVTTAEDAAVAITLTGSDVEGSVLSFSVQSGPSHGALSGTAPALTYTPAANFNGTDSFSFVANDGGASSAPATVSITVTAVNDAPVASPQSVVIQQDTAVEITLAGSDVDGDPLTFTATSPLHGTLSGTAPNRTYTPEAGYTGTDSFTFTVNDGFTSSAEATVDITVTETNEPPIADDQAVVTDEDLASAITLTGSDLDGDTLTFNVESGPSHGTLSGTAPDLTYTSAADYNGTDSFTFVVNDGLVDSAPATVSITVTPVNDAPVATAQSVTTAEDTAKSITLSGSDVDGNPMTFSVVSGPAHGGLSGTAPALTYTPTANYTGSDSFTFKVNDGTVDSAPATVSITITAVNDVPVANAQSVETAEDAAVAITLSGSDVEGGALSFSVQSGPSHGALSGTAPTLTYTPAANFNGSDSFTFVANDGVASSAPATISITVSAVNDAPVASPQSVVTQQDTAVEITLAGSDVDGDPLTFTATSPLHGTLSGTAPNRTYTPEAGYTGTDSFTFTSSDGSIISEPATIEITINPAGPLTVFFDDFESSLGWTRNAGGTDTATLGYWERANPEGVNYNGDKQLNTTVSGSYDLVTGPLAGSSAGAYDLDGGSTTMRSPEISLPTGRELTLSFSYYLTHYTNSSTSDYLRVSVVGTSTQVVFEELGAANDDDATWATFSGDISSFAGQTIRLLVAAGDMSTASYVEAAVDDIRIEATSPNSPPVADPQSLSTQEDTPLSVILTGSDPEGSNLTFETVSAPAHGSLSGTAPNLTYTPAADYYGTDSFSFVINDGKMDSEPATVAITVVEVNDAPAANAQSVTTAQDTTVGITLTGTDVDGDTLTYVVISQPLHGTLSGSAPTLTYKPAAGYTGSDSFTFKVNDGSLDSSTATVSITVNLPGPVTVFSDDFESDKGWTRNPSGTDTATLGLWERGDPAATDSSGTKQIGTTVSGSYDLVTGPLAGNNAGSYDIDGGVTTIRSASIVLPSSGMITISFKYYLAHGNNSSTADYLRVMIVGSTTTTILQELGATNDDDAAWATFSGSISGYAGQTIYILIEAADASGASLVEAAIDDVLITAQ